MQKHKNIIMSCVYRTPGSDIDRFCEYMDQLLTYANPSKTKFVCGDFNIDLLKQETHRNKAVSRMYVWSRIISFNSKTEPNYHKIVHPNR